MPEILEITTVEQVLALLANPDLLIVYIKPHRSIVEADPSIWIQGGFSKVPADDLSYARLWELSDEFETSVSDSVYKKLLKTGAIKEVGDDADCAADMTYYRPV